MTRYGLGIAHRRRADVISPDVAAGINGDDQYTKLLLHMAQGSTNVGDASVPSHGNLTHGGGAALSASQFKFLGSSLLLDGVDDYGYFNPHADFDLSTRNFTIEAFVRMTGLPTGHHGIASSGSNATNNWQFVVTSAGRLYFANNNAGTVTLEFQSAAGLIVNNVWYHVALVRSGSNFTLYLDGVAVAAGVSAAPVNNGNTAFYVGVAAVVGYYFKGFIDELRLSHIARWLSNFTPPFGPYQYESIGGIDANTKLLLHMHGAGSQTAFYDYSGQNKGQATVGGNVAIQSAQHYFHGVSAYFDGAGDYLQFPDSPDWNTNRDWTIECWVRLTAYSGQASLGTQVQSNNDEWTFAINSGGALFFQQGIAGVYTTCFGPSVIPLNTWVHVAFERSGATQRCYINGNGGTAIPVVNMPDLAAPLQIGAYLTASYFLNGHINEFRVSTSARFGGANFTPPRAPYGVQGNDGYTTVLWKGEAAVVVGCIDSSKTALPTSGFSNVGNTNSALMGKTYSGAANAYMIAPSDPAFQFGGGDFTVDCWLYYSNAAANPAIWSMYTGTNNWVCLFMYPQQRPGFQVYIGGVWQVEVIGPDGSCPMNTWMHIAVERSGNNWTIYKNGIAIAALVSSYVIPAQSEFRILSCYGTAPPAYPMNGYIDELRISKVARYKGNFGVGVVPYFGAYPSLVAGL